MATVSGIVKDSYGNPVANAAVQTADGAAAVYTDTGGNYLFMVPAGSYTMEVSKNWLRWAEFAAHADRQ